MPDGDHVTVAGIRISVASPLHWDEVGGRMRPEKFHVGNAARRLQGLHTDPWQQLRRKAQTLTAAMKRKLDIAP